jgi:hypothetical protein
VPGKQNLAKQRRAAMQIARIMYDSLQQFPEEEQERRIKLIEKVRVRKSGKSSKPVSKGRTLPRSRQA